MLCECSNLDWSGCDLTAQHHPDCTAGVVTDEIRNLKMYPRALTAVEIADHYNQAVTAETLQGLIGKSIPDVIVRTATDARDVYGYEVIDSAGHVLCSFGWKHLPSPLLLNIPVAHTVQRMYVQNPPRWRELTEPLMLVPGTYAIVGDLLARYAINPKDGDEPVEITILSFKD